MGAINYKTSKYLTLAIEPIYYDDFWKEEFESEEEFYSNKEMNEEEEYNIAENIISKYDFEFYSVTLEPGYYDGFSLYIEDNEPITTYTDKIRAHNETEKLKNLLLELVENSNMVVCFPGWCMKYLTFEESKKEIEKTMKTAHAEINTVKPEKNNFKITFIVRQVDSYLYDGEWIYNTTYNIGTFQTSAINEKKAFTRYLKKNGITFYKGRIKIEFDGDNYWIVDRKTGEILFDCIYKDYEMIEG